MQNTFFNNKNILIIGFLIVLIISWFVYKDIQYKQNLILQKESEKKLNQEAFDKCISKAEYELIKKYRDDCWVYNHDAIDCDLSYLRDFTTYESPQNLFKRMGKECEKQYPPSGRLYSSTSPDFKSLLENPIGQISEREAVRKVMTLQEFKDFFPKQGENYTVRYNVDPPSQNKLYWLIYIYKDSTNGDEIPLHHYKIDVFTGDISIKDLAINSNSCLNIIQEDAISKITNQPEVKQFQKLPFPKENKPIVEIDNSDNKSWTVHVYEAVKDTVGGHSATFNWYMLDKCTGKIKCSSNLYDEKGNFIRASNAGEYPCN